MINVLQIRGVKHSSRRADFTSKNQLISWNTSASLCVIKSASMESIQAAVLRPDMMQTFSGSVQKHELPL